MENKFISLSNFIQMWFKVVVFIFLSIVDFVSKLENR